MVKTIKQWMVLTWHSPVATTWGSFLVRAMSVGVLLPVVLRNLSPGEVTVWLLFSTINTIQGLADFGFSPTFVRMVAHANASNPAGDPNSQRSRLNEVVAKLRAVYSRVFLVVMLVVPVGGTLALQSPIERVDSQWIAWLAWLVFLAGSLAAFRMSLFQVFLLGTENVSQIRRIEMVVNVCALVLTVIVFLLGGGLLGLAVTTAAGMVLVPVLARRKAISGYPVESWSGAPLASARDLRPVFQQAWRSGLGVAATLGTFHLASIIYAQHSSADDSSSYLVAQRLIAAISAFSQAPFYAYIPLFSRHYAEGRKDLVIGLGAKSMFRSIWVYVTCTVVAGVLGGPILSAWGSTTEFVSPQVWWAFSFAILFERIGAMFIQLQSLTGLIKWHIANGISGFLMILAIAILYGRVGVIGLPLGILFGYAIFYVPYSVFLAAGVYGRGNCVDLLKIFIAPVVTLIVVTLATS